MSSVTEQEQGWIEYDYAVVQIVPRVHVGMYRNIGVVLHARRAGFLDACVRVEQSDLADFPSLDPTLIKKFADAYVRVARGDGGAGPVALLPPSERFHWLTSPRSGILQTSPVHPGRCHNLELALQKLFAEYCGAEQS